MTASPKIFIWINMATFGGATGHAMALDGHMLNTESGNHIGTVLNRLILKTKPYWDKYPLGFTLEMIPIGAKPTENKELCEAIILHKELQAAKPKAEDDEGEVFQGSDADVCALCGEASEDLVPCERDDSPETELVCSKCNGPTEPWRE